MLGLPKEAEARALLHSSSGTDMGYEVHLYSCVSPESFPAIQGLFSPYSYYLKMQFILLNLAVNGPVKKKIQAYSNQLNNSSEESFQEGSLGHEVTSSPNFSV